MRIKTLCTTECLGKFLKGDHVYQVPGEISEERARVEIAANRAIALDPWPEKVQPAAAIVAAKTSQNRPKRPNRPKKQ